MMDRLPPLGSQEFYEKCAEADKEFSSRDYSSPKLKAEKVEKPKMILQVAAHPIEIRKKGIAIYMASRGKLSYYQASRKLYTETGIDIDHHLLNQWVAKHRILTKKAKEKAQ